MLQKRSLLLMICLSHLVSQAGMPLFCYDGMSDYLCLKELIIKKEYPKLEAQLQAGIRADLADQKTKTSLLHLAVINSDIKIVELLISYGAELNAVDSDGNTPLHLALSYLDDLSAKQVALFLINQPDLDLNLTNQVGIKLSEISADEYDLAVAEKIQEKNWHQSLRAIWLRAVLNKSFT